MRHTDLISGFPTAMTIQGSAMRRHPEEAEILLRMGAILNAVQASSRYAIRNPVSDEERADRMHSWIAIGSHLTKCHVVLNTRRNGLAWELVELGKDKSEPFTDAMPLAKLREIFQRDSWFMTACFTLRDRVAFHADAEPLMTWLERQPKDAAICLFSQSGNRVQDIISDGPLQMLDHEVQKALNVQAFNDTLVHVVAALPRLLEAMCHGFVSKFGLTTNFRLVNGHHVVCFTEMEATNG
jgi:hypothetical protein